MTNFFRGSQLVKELGNNKVYVSESCDWGIQRLNYVSSGYARRSSSM